MKKEITEYAQAMRNCYRARTERDCESCPYAEDQENCDRVNLRDAADVIEGLLARSEDTREPEPKEPPEGSGTAYAVVLRAHFDAVYPMGGCTGLGGCIGCPYENDKSKCRDVGLLGAAAMIDSLWARLLETTKQLEAARGAWVPVEHKMPLIGEAVWVRVVSPGSQTWVTMARREYIAGSEVWVGFDEGTLCNPVTQWRALPPDPEQDGERRELADLLAFAKAIGLVVRCKSKASDAAALGTAK